MANEPLNVRGDWLNKLSNGSNKYFLDAGLAEYWADDLVSEFV